MAIGLYTVRAILDILGVVDYGIYNVVGGVVTIFAFMNRTLSTSSQRYFSIELARGDKERLNKWFCLNITSFMMLGLIIAFFLETVGLWFLNTQMTIPDDRLTAANVVYQLSIISFLFHIVSVPYLALIVAHEKMNVFAYVGILEAIGRLLIVFILMMLTYDKLIIYGILVLVLSIGVSMSYIIYCWRHYPESSYRWYWNTSEVKELIGFSGWHFLGTFSGSCRSQGINILLNMFFGPAVNAARAVAFQINSHILQLSSNFFTAIKPQIYKTYAKREFDELFRLIERGTIISVFLVSLITLPVFVAAEFVLGLWLKEVPEYTVIFSQLVLVNGLIDSSNGPSIAASLATGRIRKYMLTMTSITLMNIPVSCVALLMGCGPTITMVVSITISCIAVVVRANLLYQMLAFPWKKYLFLMLKMFFITLAIIFCFYLKGVDVNTFKDLFFTIVVIWSVLILAYYSIILNKEDKKAIVMMMRNRMNRL
jgi:O-antigen/teichoic acid export membrane protein